MTPFRQVLQRVVCAVAALLGIGLFYNAPLAAAECTCHAVMACGADACELAGGADGDTAQACRSVTVSADSESGAIAVCAFGDCWKGRAKITRVSESVAFWHGRFRRNSDPVSARSDVALYLNDGVGIAQISDESGPMQLSFTCSN